MLFFYFTAICKWCMEKTKTKVNPFSGRMWCAGVWASFDIHQRRVGDVMPSRTIPLHVFFPCVSLFCFFSCVRIRVRLSVRAWLWRVHVWQLGGFLSSNSISSFWFWKEYGIYRLFILWQRNDQCFSEALIWQCHEWLVLMRKSVFPSRKIISFCRYFKIF